MIEQVNVAQQIIKKKKKWWGRRGAIVSSSVGFFGKVFQRCHKRNLARTLMGMRVTCPCNCMFDP